MSNTEIETAWNAKPFRIHPNYKFLASSWKKYTLISIWMRGRLKATQTDVLQKQFQYHQLFVALTGGLSKLKYVGLSEICLSRSFSDVQQDVLDMLDSEYAKEFCNFKEGQIENNIGISPIHVAMINEQVPLEIVQKILSLTSCRNFYCCSTDCFYSPIYIWTNWFTETPERYRKLEKIVYDHIFALVSPLRSFASN